MAERFDAVVVGAGPAGSAAALALAREKFSVLLVERGRAAGTKNMFGGRVYAWPLFDLLPEWEKDCPVQRFVTEESLVFLSGDASLSVQFDSPRAGTDRASSFTTSLTDTNPYPANGCTDAPYTSVCITDGQLQDELQSFIAANGLLEQQPE